MLELELDRETAGLICMARDGSKCGGISVVAAGGRERHGPELWVNTAWTHGSDGFRKTFSVFLSPNAVAYNGHVAKREVSRRCCGQWVCSSWPVL